MDIKHLDYFITIAENNFNLTQAAEILHVSQPALTKFIREFEGKEEVELFVRYKGRLVALTALGKEFLKNAITVTESYKLLYSCLRDETRKINGVIKVGIPPVILPILFNEIIPKFILENPNIELKIVEAGAYELKKMLLLQEIDVAFLITPIATPNISQKTAMVSTVSAIYNKNHRFAKSKTPINYKELEKEKLVILNSSFMLHHQIIKNFEIHECRPNIIFQSGSWDLLVSMCKRLDVVTILPTPIIHSYPSDEVMFSDISPSFPWKVILCTLENIFHNSLVKFTVPYFSKELSKLNY